MQQVARTANSLADLFSFIVPLASFKEVDTLTHKYCYKDWVVEKYVNMKDGETKKMRHLIDVLDLLD